MLINSLDQVPQGHIQSLHVMIDTVMKSLNCPLSSHYVCQLWPYIVKVAISDENTGNLYAFSFNY